MFKLEKMQPDNSWAVVAGAESLTSDENGLIEVTGLLLGQYRFVELVPPTGYFMEAQTVEFAITSTTPNYTVNVTAKNTKSPVLGSVVLTKVDADDQGVKLPGAVFMLEEQASDGTWTDVPGYEALTTDGSGLIEVRDLAMGTYRFVEVSAPEGYELGTEPVEFSLAEGTPGLAVAVTALNAKSPVFGKAVLTKVDAGDASVKLPGATFKLEQRLADDSWETVPGNEALTTGADGIVEVADLPVGDYRFVETAAPEGYVLDETPVAFEVAVGQPAQAELTMKNAPVPPDPVDPVDPTDPTDPTNPTNPTDPTDPSNPGTPSSTNKPSSSSPASIARTGDAFPLAAVLGALCAVVAGSLVTAVAVARHRARRD